MNSFKNKGILPGSVGLWSNLVKISASGADDRGSNPRNPSGPVAQW